MSNTRSKVRLALAVLVILPTLAMTTMSSSNPTTWNLVSAATVNHAQYDLQDNVSGDPGAANYLKSFNYGTTSNLTNGTTVRNYTLLAEETHFIPITMEENATDQIIFPAWTYNGTVPAPTLRMTEGDIVNIKVINSPQSKHHHSLHMHSIHDPSMDGTMGTSGGDIAPGDSFTYTFVAGPVGLYPYHCHVEPIQDHINRGLYGAMIIDPKEGRAPANEMVMMMNSYDLDLNPQLLPNARPPTVAEANNIMYPKPVVEEAATTTGDEDRQGEEAAATEEEDAAAGRPELEAERDNEIYTINGKAFEYMKEPIQIKQGEPVRLYLLSMTEFDPVNNFHLHSGMFKYIPAGTEGSDIITTDIVTLGQGDRGVIEFTPQHKGMMMFHSHIAEFAQLGWMSFFQVV